MGFFGRRKNKDGSVGSRSSRKKKSPIEDGYPAEGKKKKIKKLKLRMKRKKKKKPDEDKERPIYDDRPNRRRGKSRDDEEFDEYENEGDFEAENDNRGRLREIVESRVNPGGDGRRFRVKPYHAFPEAVFMDDAELYQFMTQPSDEFDFLTSYLNPSTKATRRVKVADQVRRHFGTPREDGRIGSLRVEVLGCVGMDRAKPEVSVYMVVGDCAFATDVITGCRSPMFPPSCRRAAVFPLHHAYARLFIGVFDLKANKKSEQDHFCGRVAIDLPPLRPDTEYDCTFPIRASTFIYDRRPRGVIRLRFSLHWFSERAVIMSYLKRPRNPLAFSRQAKKQPTIPCGDPKTFRNVAVTVHGQDFPGKYTRGAFRATMREFNLYQQNLRFLSKITIIDCILWENPLMSLYLFSTSLYCVYLNSVRLMPPFFIGWLIYLLFENYLANNRAVAGHLGYQPLSILEIFLGLLRDGKGSNLNFKPIGVKKRPRRQVMGEEGKLIDIELANHREFPFSERFTYPKFAASDAIAAGPAKNQKKGKKGAIAVAAKDDQATARRLSIYTTPQGSRDEESEADSSSDEEESEHDRDEEGMMDHNDDGYGEMGDSDEEQDNDEEDAPEKKTRINQSGKASTKRRIRVGPEQNSDKSGRKQPPQAHLSRVEHMLHRASKNISVEHVHFPPPNLQANLGKDYNAKGPAGDVMTAKEKQNFDEFDRMLGFRTKNPNPILRITSSFLGPLMRIIRIVVYAARIGFNVTAWTDPFLTFWVFAFLCTLAFILLIFPWRTFFLVSTLVLLGPQNIGVRMYLERRAREKEIEKAEKAEREKEEAKRRGLDQRAQEEAAAAAALKEEEEKKKKKKKKGGLFGNKKVDEEEELEEINEADLYHSPRPAFYAHTKPTRRTQVPRDVAVPYFRFRKERFFDWPPDPTVSRAVALLADGGGGMSGSVHDGRRRGRSRGRSYDESDDDEYFEDEDEFGEE